MTLSEFVEKCEKGEVEGSNYYGDAFGIHRSVVNGQPRGWEYAVMHEEPSDDDPSSWTGFVFNIPPDVVVGE